MPFKEYKNSDPNCAYPFGNGAFEYCWQFAMHVDKKRPLNCSNCQFYIPKLSNKELQSRLIYSIIVAGKSAKFAENAMKKLFNPITEPFNQIRLWILGGVLEAKLQEAKTGNYGKLAKALMELVKSNINLRFCQPSDLEKIHGIGPKTSRFFIMWTRPNVRYAALDVHILRWLRERGYNVPKSTPSGKKYQEIEDIFLDEADNLGLSPQALDKEIWSKGSGYMNWSPEKEVSNSYLA